MEDNEARECGVGVCVSVEGSRSDDILVERLTKYDTCGGQERRSKHNAGEARYKSPFIYLLIPVPDPRSPGKYPRHSLCEPKPLIPQISPTSCDKNKKGTNGSPFYRRDQGNLVTLTGVHPSVSVRTHGQKRAKTQRDVAYYLRCPKPPQ